MSHFYIVGSGLCGSVIARILADKGHKITILERRNHIGGNLYDERDSRGFLVQRYGPHAFHTNNERVWEFVNKYSSWKDYRLSCGAFIEDKVTPTPFNFQTADDFFSKEKAEAIKCAFVSKYPERKTVGVLEALESDNSDIRTFAEFLFEEDYSLYTAKQWGISPKDIDKSVLERVPLRLSYEEGYFDDKYQALPEKGYTEFIKNLLDSANIEIELNTDALSRIRIDGGNIYIDGQKTDDVLIYTGAVDELLGFSLGELPYRSLSFKWEYADETNSFQKYPIVAYPKSPGYTRITEYTKLPIQSGIGTVYAHEYPSAYVPGESEPYYPVITDKSIADYQSYRESLHDIGNLVLCGRLADFKYYNMDQAIERAFDIADSLTV